MRPVFGILSLLRWAGILAALGTLVLGHVTVWPRRARPGSYEKYAVRVPTEGDSPTVQVRIEVPPGLMIRAVQPKVGWSWEAERDTEGRITAVSWSGGELMSGEFDEFCLSSLNPAEAGQLVWRAYQTHRDGRMATFANSPGADGPAPVTELGPTE